MHDDDEHREVIHNLYDPSGNIRGNLQELHAPVVGGSGAESPVRSSQPAPLTGTVDSRMMKAGDGHALCMRWMRGGMRNHLSKTSAMYARAARRDMSAKKSVQLPNAMMILVALQSPLSMSRSSRKGSALGAADASCRIAL